MCFKFLSDSCIYSLYPIQHLLPSGCATSFNISYRLSFRCDANFKIPTNIEKNHTNIVLYRKPCRDIDIREINLQRELAFG